MLSDRMAAIRTKSRVRALASHERAGAWSRRRARELRREFMRRAWRMYPMLAGLYVFVAAATWWVPGWLRTFLWGFETAAVVGVGWFYTFVFSGTVHLYLGDVGEQWSAEALKGLRRHRWRVVHHVVLKHGDIDHLLIGPGGVVVVETKGGTTDWGDAKHRPRIEAAVRQAAENARLVRLFLRPDIGNAPVRWVVALWPSSNLDGADLPEGVVPGGKLRSWIDRLPTEVLGPEQVRAAWQRIAKQVAKRDDHDLERLGPPPVPVEQRVIHLTQFVAGVGLGVLVTMMAAATGFWGWMVGAVAAMVPAAWARARYPGRVRRLATGAFLALGVAVVFALSVVGLSTLFG